jgi:hypothetical protein
MLFKFIVIANYHFSINIEHYLALDLALERGEKLGKKI